MPYCNNCYSVNRQCICRRCKRRRAYCNLAQGCEGDTVKVMVSYNNNQGTSGFEFRMYYDPDVLELVKITLSEDVFIEDVVILGDKNANEKMTNFVSYAVAMAKENKKSGELYTVEFKIKDGAAIGKYTAVTES